MSLFPTPEQTAICDSARTTPTSLMLNAYAGCAKTTTLELLAKTLPVGPSLALAFNTRIKGELEKRFPTHFMVKTLNGLGHGAWGKALGKRLTLDDRKLGKLITQMGKDQELDLSQTDWSDVKTLVSGAMQQGLVPDHFTQLGLVPDNMETWDSIAEAHWLTNMTEAKLQFARQVLVEHIKLALQGTISFDDQIYMPTLFGGVFPRFPLTMVDESQDLSPLNHLMVKRSSAGRIIAVGDPKQAIYAFRGADSDSMTNLRKIRPDWLDHPLATTFRCPHVIVARQQSHAPGFTAWHTNIQGRHVVLPAGGHDSWSWSDITALVNSTGKPAPTVAILCRNNAPLVRMAFGLLRTGHGCQMLGRDIGKGLVSLVKKLFPDPTVSGLKCIETVNKWLSNQVALARANGQDGKIAGLTDRAECLLAVLESQNIQSAKALEQAIETLFARDTGKIILSSGHRAKGFEWDVVLHLNPALIPSRFAIKAAAQGFPAQLVQENNLRYVIETRAKHTLIDATLETFSHGI